ncbi:glycosyltransferase family 4 protein [Candidatus Uhrbacteria bacterium]|nr:glycosyltransferase family 4 protein [Candidatus Uhrbacteria bacterium]
MKRTLLVTLDYYPALGGVSRYWERLGDLLPPDFFVVLAPSLPKGMPERSARYPIIRRRMLVSWLYPHWLPMFLYIAVACRRYRIERIVAAQVLPVGTATMGVARLLHIPFIVSAHGMDLHLPKKNKRKYTLCKKIFKRAERVIVNCAATGRVAESYGVPASHIESIYPSPVIVPALLEAGGNSAAVPDEFRQKRIIITVGRLVPRKGHEYILRALPGILAERPDVLYCIIGDGPYRVTLEGLVEELHLTQSVHFAGPLSDGAIAQWYAASFAFIMTPVDIDGDVEGFGIVYLEAQSFGKPVIGSRTGGVPEAIHDGVTGLLVEPKDVVAIQHAILRILHDPGLAQRFGDAGRKRVAEEFSWKKQAEKLQYLLSL